MPSQGNLPGYIFIPILQSHQKFQPKSSLMNIEEQEQELEVLQSIYPDELKVKSPTNYAVKIKLDTPSRRIHIIALLVKYPEDYPEVLPELDVNYASTIMFELLDEEEVESDDESDEDDEDEDQDAKEAMALSEYVDFDGDDFDLLRQKVLDEAELCIGMPMIFTLVGQLKEDAEALFQKILDKKQKEWDDKVAIREAAEQEKFKGTPVTKESYEKWRLGFRKEMKTDEYFQEKFEQMHLGKMTGREIFEKGLAEEEDVA